MKKKRPPFVYLFILLLAVFAAFSTTAGAQSADPYRWDFDTAGDMEGWGRTDPGNTEHTADGTVRYTYPGKWTQSFLKKSGFSLPAADFKGIEISLKYEFIPTTPTTNQIAEVYFTGTRADGSKFIESESTAIITPLSISSNGEFEKVFFPFSSASFLEGATIHSIRIDMMKYQGAWELDYIRLVEADPYRWDFDTANDMEGWTRTDPGNTEHTADGTVRYTYPGKWTQSFLRKTGFSLRAADFKGIEVLLKYEFAPSAAAKGMIAQAYFKGIRADGSSFTESEATSIKATLSASSNGEFKTVFFDFANAAFLKGAEISSIRLDFMKDQGSWEVDYIRLIPDESARLPALDPSKLALQYTFADKRAGSADGVISMDFGGQEPAAAENIRLYWASGTDADGFAALSDYTVLRALSGKALAAGYTVSKNLCIPAEATALIAEVTDREKTFTVAYLLPEGKRPVGHGKLLYTAAFISDIHCGGWGSENAPSARLLAAREQIGEYADFAVINGDLTQWYGAYSATAFNYYHDSSYNSNGETSTDPAKLYAGKSQWEVLTDYLKGFTVPVYAVQGNHDIPDGAKWNPVCCNDKLWFAFLKEWVDYSNTAEGAARYAVPVERDETVSYYDTEINGQHYIFLQIPRAEQPNYRFSAEQLAWLDRKLYEKEASGKPIFVFGHVPVESELSGGFWDEQLKNSGADAAFKAILSKHPSAIYVSGHTHYSHDTDFLGAIDGAGATYSLLNDGGVATIAVPNDETNPDKTTERQQSHGVFAEVYEDGIVIRARDFTQKKWIARGLTELTFRAPCAASSLAVYRDMADGKTVLHAVSDAGEGARYVWYLNGEEYAAGVSAAIDAAFGGYIALRVYDADGGYRSEVYETIDSIPCFVQTGDTAEFRDKQPTGLRFFGSVSRELLDGTEIEVTEYGFVAGLVSIVGTSPRLGENGVKYGVGYSKASGVNRIYAEDAERITFTCALVGIPQNGADAEFAAAPYLKFVRDGKEYTVYGSTARASLSEVIGDSRQ